MFTSFCTLNKIAATRKHEIWSIFGGLKLNFCIKFGANLINIPRYARKTKSNFCHACRINLLEEQVENWYVARSNIKRMPFGG